MHIFRGESSHRTTGAPARKLWHALHEVDKYLIGQSGWLVNYAKRRRASLRVGTSITEGTANFLVNRRMNKSQQMRWSRRGADLLLQVRCAVYNGNVRRRARSCVQSNLPAMPTIGEGGLIPPISGQSHDALRADTMRRRTQEEMWRDNYHFSMSS